METMVYRKRRGSLMGHTSTGDEKRSMDETGASNLLQDAEAWHPTMFYPRIAETELTMWSHWLPTTFVFERSRAKARDAFFATLARLSAPQDVAEECQWAWAMDLFEAYELRTPERRDLRDPLVLGCLGTQRYRIAMWGGSLRPLEEIRELVQNSLKLRKRAAKWQTWSLVSGAILGLILGLWMASQTAYPGDQLVVSMVSALLGSFCFGLPFLLYTPENRQQHFLDRYRQ